jgi:hypothetical protein
MGSPYRFLESFMIFGGGIGRKEEERVQLYLGACISSSDNKLTTTAIEFFLKFLLKNRRTLSPAS